jgi:type II secretory pathway pseudopilin PulG
MNRRRDRGLGFTLVEMMVALTIMLFVIIALISLIISTQRTHLTEGRKLDMNQGSRLIEQLLYDNFRSSASVLSLANTPTLLSSTVIPFNGVFPLNNVAYPDGVILAAGDPYGLTRLTADFTPGQQLVNVVTVNLADNSDVAWHENDMGLVMRTDGYLVFRVTATPNLGATQLTARATPVYFSGLLNTANYNDSSDERFGTTGYNVTYPGGSPVVRLDAFTILLTRTEADGTRTLTLTNDCDGVQGDIFSLPITDTRAIPVLPNIGDLQIEYLTHDVPVQIWAGSEAARADPCPAGSEGSGSCQDFYSQFFTRNISAARIHVLLRTEEEREKRSTSGVVFSKPRMGDAPAAMLPVGRFHYSYMQYEVLIRNFNNVY